MSQRIGGLLNGAHLGSHVRDSLEKLTRQSVGAPEVVKGDDWPTFSLLTEPATVVDGGGCCLLHQKWLGSGSIGVGH